MMLPYQVAAESLRNNIDQWAAYQSNSHCVLLAGPGSGKTKTLTIKMARMLNEDISPPRGIACITYSRECARELVNRLSILGVSERSSTFVGTVHSFCLNNVLIPYGEIAGLRVPFPLKLATERIQSQVFNEVSQKYIERGYRRSDLKKSVDLLRNTNIDRGSTEWDSSNNDVAELALTYEAGLRALGCIDYTDQVILGLELIERYEWIRRLLKARFPILIVDEYQDLGAPLDRLVRRLCFETGIRLFAVGDPDQSIYSFMGADPSLLESLASHPGVESIRLRTNYRSGKSIVNASKLVLGQEREFWVPDGTPAGDIEIHHLENGLVHQAQHISQVLIPNAIQAGTSPEKMAILYPTGNEGEVISTALDEAGYQYLRIDKNAPYERTPFIRWLEDCAAWCSEGWKVGEPSLANLVRTWAKFNSIEPLGSVRSSVEQELLGFLWRSRLPEQRLETWLTQIEAFCLNNFFLVHEELEDEKLAFDKLKRAASRTGKLGHFTVRLFSCQRGAPNHLNLSTLHSSKGLEFDMVIMFGMDQGRIPWAQCDNATRNEQRRLFYVGTTRAKRYLHYTYSGWIVGWDGERRNLGPSEFLNEISRMLG